MVKKRVSRSSNVGSSRELNVHSVAHALGILNLIVIVFYAVFVWFAGYEGLYVARQFPITFNFNDWTFIFGIVQAYVLGYVAGWIFARIYNKSS
jgi:uncharacterized membrane protein (DUF485 family)